MPNHPSPCRVACRSKPARPRTWAKSAVPRRPPRWRRSRAMSDASKPASSQSPWDPYLPSPKAPWNLRRVVHLHRRAGFAATWSEIERDLKDGPKASIDRILAGKACSEGVPDQFAEKADLLGSTAASSRDAARLKAWWVFRMLFGPDPLTERLVLMWHNHLATSNLKVE